jgi:hypothetical protein
MDSFDQFMQLIRQYINHEDLTNLATCAICQQPFYILMRWGDHCTHSFCLECLWCFLHDPDGTSITRPQCPLCRSPEYAFKFDSEMDNYMREHQIVQE